MVRNESVARIVMFVCFGTAFLSLAVHWRISAAQRQYEQQTAKTGNRLNRLYERLPSGGIGETAFGASVPAGETTPGKTAERANTPKSSTIQPHNTSGKVNQNVAIATDTPKESRLAAPEEKQKPNLADQIKSLLPLTSNQQKSSNRLDAMKTQVVVDLSDRRTYVYAGDLVIASYPIAIGKKGWETPTGSFQVKHMQHDPIWKHPITGQIFPAGSDSPLGERWIGFWSDGRNEIGFHGTPDIHLLGTAISHGCLRMRNADVRLLYEQVRVGTRVIVQE